MGNAYAEMGQVRRFLADVNLSIIKAAAARRQGRMGRAAKLPGARPQPSIAAPAVEAVVLTEMGHDGKAHPVTPLGYKTARRRLPRLLDKLLDHDPRRRAAEHLADTVERLGSKGVTDLMGTAPKSAISDGGATTRIKYATRLRLLQAHANGWQVDRRGAFVVGEERVALRVGRQTGKLKEIKTFEALVQLCAYGVSGDEIMRRHGWVPKSQHRKRFAEALLSALDDMAHGAGFGRWSKETS